jgi:hypothetical protein
MAYVLLGQRGATWRCADWVLRNALDYLIPALRREPGGERLVEALTEPIHQNRSFIDLSQHLSNPALANSWDAAVMVAIGDLYREGTYHWYAPEHFSAMVGVMRNMCGLVGYTADLIALQRYQEFNKANDVVDFVFRKLFRPSKGVSDLEEPGKEAKGKNP